MANRTQRRDVFSLFSDLEPASEPDPAGVETLAGARSIAVGLLSPNPYQPRETIDAAALSDLAASITQLGVLQPLLVRQNPDDPEAYQIGAGERRWRAAQLAGLEAVPCIVRALDDDALAVIGLVENLQRDDLTPLDEARAYRRLMDRLGLSMRALSERLGKSHTFVEDRLKLVSDPRIEAAIEKGVVGATVAVEIADLDDTATRDALLARADRGERIKVKDVQATRARSRAQPAPVADNLPVTMPPDALVGTITQEGDGQKVADNLPHVPVVARSLSAPVEVDRTAARTTDADMAVAGNDRSRVTRRPPSRNRVAAADTQTGRLFDAGAGYADPDQLLAALWADLEALGG